MKLEVQDMGMFDVFNAEFVAVVTQSERFRDQVFVVKDILRGNTGAIPLEEYYTHYAIDPRLKEEFEEFMRERYPEKMI